MKNNIRIMMIEDHPEFREAIEFVLNKSEDYELLSQFGNAELALRSLEYPNEDSDIHIILLDLNLPGISGLKAIPWIKEYRPKIKIIVLSQSDAEADVLQAIKSGADGYLLKSSTMDQIKQGIRNVYDGEATLDSRLAKFILGALKEKLPPKEEVEVELTKRELQVLEAVAEGLSQKEIGKQLNISSYTVTDHLKSVYEKLKVQNAPQAVNKAYRTGIFRAED